MAYKKKFYNDKTIITLSIISVVAVAALVGGAVLDAKSKENKNESLVDLNEEYNYQQMADSETHTKSPSETSNQTRESESETTSQIVAEVPSTSDVEESTTPIPEDNNVSVSSPASRLKFSKESILTWPVDGNIVLDYDMENTIYFPTLDLYKCSDAIVIQAETGTPVYCAAECIITNISSNEEIGTFVVTDLGNEYSLTYGQLKDVVVENGDILSDGDLIGYVNEPTRYFSLEGSNLYLKMTENGSPTNPLDYLNYE